MKTAIRMFVAMSLMVAFTAGTFAQEWTKEQQEIWQVVEDGWAKWAKKDMDASMALLHEKYQGWNNDDPMPFDKKKMGKWYAAMKDFMSVEWYDITPVRIAVTENAAVVDYYFSAYFIFDWGEKKIEKEVKGKNVEFYVKEKGKWYLLGDMSVHDDEEEKDKD